MIGVTVRKGLEGYFKQNKLRYFLILLCLVAGLVIGILLACKLNGTHLAEMAKNVKKAVDELAQKSKFEIYISLVLKNFRCVSLVYVFSIFIYTMPLIFVYMCICGLSVGFTLSFFSFGFGKVGFALGLMFVATQVFAMLPLEMFLSVTAVDCTLHNIKTNKRTKKRNRKKLFMFCVAVFILLCIFSLLDLTAAINMSKAVSALL